MNCEEFRSFMHAYVDGEFDERERVELEVHLSKCSGCRDDVNFYRIYRQKMLENCPRDVTPLRVKTSLRARLREEAQPERGIPIFSLSFATVFATVFVGFVFFPSMLGQKDGTILSSISGFIDRLMEDGRPMPVKNSPVHISQAEATKKAKPKPKEIVVTRVKPMLPMLPVQPKEMRQQGLQQNVAAGTPSRFVRVRPFEARSLAMGNGRNLPPKFLKDKAKVKSLCKYYHMRQKMHNLHSRIIGTTFPNPWGKLSERSLAVLCGKEKKNEKLCSFPSQSSKSNKNSASCKIP